MNNNNILVSIIVPVYNTEHFLERCINSLIQQEYNNLEIILVDDGSHDRSGVICDHFKENDKRIKVIHKENEGVVKARIDAYNIALGDYIAFVDSDDYLDLRAISIMVDFVTRYKADLIVCQYIDVYGEDYIPNIRSIKGIFTRKEIKKLFKTNLLYDSTCWGSGIPLHLCEKLIKKELLQHALYKAEGQWFGEDLISTLYVLDKTNKMYVSDQHIYYYVHHPNEVINKSHIEKWPAYEVVWKRIIEFDKNNYFINQLPDRIWAFTKSTVSSIISSDNFSYYMSGFYTVSKSPYLKKYIFRNRDFILKNKDDKILYYLLKYKLYTIYYIYKLIKKI